MSLPGQTQRLPDHFDDEGEVRLTPLVALNFVLRHRVLLAVMFALGLAVGVVQALMLSPWYQASVTFVMSPGEGRAAAGVVDEVEQPYRGNPFHYYSTVLSSTVVMNAVLKDKLSDGVTVLDRLSPPGTPPGQREALARERLADANPKLESSTRSWGDEMPVLTISAGWTDPGMAAELTNLFQKALADFDKDIRTKAAKDRREFIEKQVTEKANQLKDTEDKLRMFTEKNRLLIPNDAPNEERPTTIPPQLTLGRDQLQREIDLQRDLYVSLKTSYEEAKISELDNASALVVVEAAVPPKSRSGASRRGVVLMRGMIGLVLGLGLALLLEFRMTLDVSSPEAREFAGHLADIRGGLRRFPVPSVPRLPGRELAEEPPEQKHDV